MVSFNVNEKKRVVCAVIQGDGFDAINRIIKRVGVVEGLDLALMPEKFLGVATCHPEDAFDVEAGKKLALARVNRAYEVAFNNAIKTWKDHHLKVVENAFPTVNKK